MGAFTSASSLFIAGCGNTGNESKNMARWYRCNICTIWFKDKDNNGKLAGFDIDIIMPLLRGGIEADVQNLNFDALLPALQK